MKAGKKNAIRGINEEQLKRSNVTLEFKAKVLRIFFDTRAEIDC